MQPQSVLSGEAASLNALLQVVGLPFSVDFKSDLWMNKSPPNDARRVDPKPATKQRKL
jgi:hypothetical protein